MNRRQLITGLISLVAAPAIVRAGSLMPVKVMNPLWIDGHGLICGHVYSEGDENGFADATKFDLFNYVDGPKSWDWKVAGAS
jgi:hypothetical protein